MCQYFSIIGCFLYISDSLGILETKSLSWCADWPDLKLFIHGKLSDQPVSLYDMAEICYSETNAGLL